MDRKAWHATVQGVEKSKLWLSDWTELIRQKSQMTLQLNILGENGIS